MRYLLSLLMFLLAATAHAQAAEPVRYFNVILLQPSATLEERVPRVDAMADYVRAVEAATREAVIASGARQAVGGFVVVAVRPGMASKVWLDFDALLDLELRKQIVAKVGAVRPFEVLKGPVVFALKVATWNGKESKRPAPAPQEWKQAKRAGAAPEVGELVESIWND
ncbi:MAG TPA: hypothetical protein VJN44_02405 [Roseateles sp.]|nr:hypothetical protein [Roseateles sp.]